MTIAQKSSVLSFVSSGCSNIPDAATPSCASSSFSLAKMYSSRLDVAALYCATSSFLRSLFTQADERVNILEYAKF
jgi:hypothetical protein